MRIIDTIAQRLGYEPIETEEQTEDADLSEPIEIERRHLESLVILSISNVDSLNTAIQAFDNGDKAQTFSNLGAEVENSVQSIHRIEQDSDEISTIIDEVEQEAEEAQKALQERLPEQVENEYIQ